MKKNTNKLSKLSRKNLALIAIGVVVLAAAIGALVARSQDYMPSDDADYSQESDPDDGTSPIDEVEAEDSTEAN